MCGVAGFSARRHLAMAAYTSKDPSLPPARLDAWGNSFDRWFDAHQKLFLAVSSLLCILTFSGYSAAKVPWMDEVLLLTISRLPTLGQIWSSLMDGIQTDPPTLQVLVHYLFRIFGEHVYLARLPAILGFTLMCVCLSLLVRRHAPALFAAAAFFLPYATFLRVRAMDARPYGLMMGFTALSLLLWDKLGDSDLGRPLVWRVAFTLSLAITFSTHFYSILLLLPLGVGELTRWIVRRKLDWSILICVALSLIPFVIWLPILRSGMKVFQVAAKHYHGKPAFQNFFDFYSTAIATMPIAMFLLLALAAAVLSGRFRNPAGDAKSLEPSARPAFAAALSFLIIPAVGYAAAVAVTGFFTGYYYMISVFGVILGLPFAVSAVTSRSRLAGACLFLAIATQGLFVTARGLSGFVRHDSGYPALSQLRALLPGDGDIVLSDPADFLAFHEANGNSPQDNLIFLYDPEKALKELATDTSDILYRQLKPYTNARIESFERYTAAHPHYYLATNSTAFDDWQYPYLVKRAHAGLFWLGKGGDFDLFRVDLAAAPQQGALTR